MEGPRGRSLVTASLKISLRLRPGIFELLVSPAGYLFISQDNHTHLFEIPQLKKYEYPIGKAYQCTDTPQAKWTLCATIEFLNRMARLHTELDEDLHRKFKERFASDGVSMKQWILDAALKKLHGPKQLKAFIPDPLAGLPSQAERTAAQRYIKGLKTYPEEFRQALIETAEAVHRLYAGSRKR